MYNKKWILHLYGINAMIYSVYNNMFDKRISVLMNK